MYYYSNIIIVNQLTKIYCYHDSLTKINKFANKIYYASEEKFYLNFLPALFLR